MSRHRPDHRCTVQVTGATWTRASSRVLLKRSGVPWVRTDGKRADARSGEHDGRLQRAADAAGAVGGERLSEASVRRWALQWRWHWPGAPGALRWVAEALTWREVATLDPQGHTGGWLSGEAIDRRLQARAHRARHSAARRVPLAQRVPLSQLQRCDGG
jgi:hypothetical protein